MYKINAYFLKGLFIIFMLATLLFLSVCVVAVQKLIDNPSKYIPTFVFCSGLTLLLLAMTIFTFKRGNLTLQNIKDNVIFSIAIKNHGFLTVMELAASKEFTLNTARESLEAHCSQGICEKKYTDEMVAVYFYREVISDVQKATSTRVIDAL